MSQGKLGERGVHSAKSRMPSPQNPSGWELIYNDPLHAKPEPLEISLLTVQGASLYGAPDYVFRHDATRTIVIVEIKVSDAELGSDGWLNLRAQLWAYGHIDRFVDDAKHIVLVGEVWSTTIRLRQTLKWSMSDEQLCTQNEELFEIYKKRV